MEENNTEPVISTTQPLSEHPCGYCDRVFGSAPALRMHKIRKHSGKNWDTSRNFNKKKKKGRPWIPGQLEKFRATMRRRAASKHGFKSSKRIQIVYPDPRDAEQVEPTRPEIRFCPYCGFNIEKHNQ